MAKRLSLDETGIGSMKNLDSVDSQRYPIFGVGGTIMKENYAQNILPNKTNPFKIDILGNADVVLHTSDIIRDRKEFRGHKLDAKLMKHWQTIQKNGTANFTTNEIATKITSFTLHTKKENITSLEIADLIINPIGSYVLNGLEKPDWKIVKSKIPTHGKFWSEAGIIQLPENIISLHDILSTIK